ncbi:YidH family protein [Estrella lausannensis]|uniref:Putative membrane protein n=1 Tax=Estrella lausannensis TaxID=483423 RepID=A0A0H5DNL7_9BACT|nr:DUF202 domain-containing protein [Estrella lausannensis]CRX37956.1 putative membrane protein [Estrella lausannensis]
MSSEEDRSVKSSHARDHMANERTFLAWIRTSIGIMAFGFVVEKFGLFINQMGLLLGNSNSPILRDASHSLQRHSSAFGICLVALGVLICLLAFVKYKKVEKQIETNTFQASILLDIMITLSVFLIGIFLIIYLNSHVLASE